METLKDFLATLKDRVSNPLISSFILLWLVFNYHITIGLIFYSQQELARDGYRSYFDLIQNCYNTENSFWKPLKYAALYTFIFPIFKYIFKVFVVFIREKSTRFIIWMTNSDSIRLDVHRVELSNALKEKEQYLKLIANQSGVREENTLLVAEIEVLKSKHEQQITKLNTDHDAVVQRMISSETDRINKLNIDWENQIQQLRLIIQEKDSKIASDEIKHKLKIDTLNLELEHHMLIFKGFVVNIDQALKKHPTVDISGKESSITLIKQLVTDSLDYIHSKD